MKLLSLRVSCPETLGDFELSFRDEDGTARSLTVIYGGPGAGKTTLLSAIANTRPGHTVVISVRPSDPPCIANGLWQLGMDEPDREQPLLLWSPNAEGDFRPTETDARKDASFFDRLAREGGFVFQSFSATRWFSKSPLMLTTPERTVARYDVRATEPFDDAGRNDLAREVKQALAYAAIVRALPHSTEERERLLGQAMLELVTRLAQVYGYEYRELEPRSLEPVFLHDNGNRCRFDALPTATKHAIAFGVLPLRALWAGYPGMDPRRAQGVVAIDQLELHQSASTARAVLDVLLQELPEVQWLVTTRSDALLAACSPEQTLALRRIDEPGLVQVFQGGDARLH